MNTKQKKMIALQISEEMYNQLKELTDKTETNLSYLIRSIIRKYLESEKK